MTEVSSSMMRTAAFITPHKLGDPSLKCNLNQAGSFVVQGFRGFDVHREPPRDDAAQVGERVHEDERYNHRGDIHAGLNESDEIQQRKLYDENQSRENPQCRDHKLFSVDLTGN